MRSRTTPAVLNQILATLPVTRAVNLGLGAIALYPAAQSVGWFIHLKRDEMRYCRGKGP